ncbi:MAG: hypothetical protein E2P02_14910 [Acidobacteria bacterium]|nr:MAG: hypothetical protein E2P02_14910 [Acidobacteriota bacterium]
MQFMRPRLTCLLLLGTLSTPPSFAWAEERLNVVLIVADYMAYGDIGPYGSTDIRTPSLDRLAREGTRFTNAYAAAPICSPSRVGLVTGRYPQRAGFEENVGGPGRTVGLEATETTIARMLQEAGYATAMFGKWHLEGSSSTTRRRATASTSSWSQAFRVQSEHLHQHLARHVPEWRLVLLEDQPTRDPVHRLLLRLLVLGHVWHYHELA